MIATRIRRTNEGHGVNLSPFKTKNEHALLLLGERLLVCPPISIETLLTHALLDMVVCGDGGGVMVSLRAGRGSDMLEAGAVGGAKRGGNGERNIFSACSHLLKSVLDLVGLSLRGAYPPLQSPTIVGPGVPALFRLRELTESCTQAR